MLSNLNEEKLTPLRCFIDYVSLKLHFSGDMVWKPDVRLRLTEETLNGRADSKFFYSLAERTKTRSEYVSLMVSAFYRDKNFWIGDHRNQEVIEFHKKRLRRFISRRQNFLMDVENLHEYMNSSKRSLRELLKIGSPPGIIRDKREIIGGVTEETLAILDFYFDFCGGVESDDPYWDEDAFRISRYKYFCRPGKGESPEFERCIHKLLGV